MNMSLVLSTLPCGWNYFCWGAPKTIEDLTNPTKARFCPRAEKCLNNKVGCTMLYGLSIAWIVHEEKLNFDQATEKIFSFLKSEKLPDIFLYFDNGIFIQETTLLYEATIRAKWFAELILSGKNKKNFPFKY